MDADRFFLKCKPVIVEKHPDTGDIDQECFKNFLVQHHSVCFYQADNEEQ